MAAVRRYIVVVLFLLVIVIVCLIGVVFQRAGTITDNAGPETTRYSTLTRYGANLHFDPVQQCPDDSLMRTTNWKTIKPRTHLCPELFIIGTKKGGTTSLYTYLTRHPDFKGILDETVFSGETFYFRSKYSSTTILDYVNLFPPKKMSGDASVDNLPFCESPERILETCGFKTKIVMLLRHPIQRYISNFMMRIRPGPSYNDYNYSVSIFEKTTKEFSTLKDKLREKGMDFPKHKSEWLNYRCLFSDSCCESMIYEGMYYVFVMNWLCNFPKENIMILNSDEMFHNPSDIYAQVVNFIGLEKLSATRLKNITSTVYNKGSNSNLPRHRLSNDHRQMLNNIYRPFNQGLLELLDWPIDWS